MENAVSNVEEIQTLMFQPSQKKKSTENNELPPLSREQSTPNPHDELLDLSKSKNCSPTTVEQMFCFSHRYIIGIFSRNWNPWNCGTDGS